MHIQNKKYRNFASILYRLTGQCTPQKFEKMAFLAYGHVYIIWSYQEAKIKPPMRLPAVRDGVEGC